MSRLALYLLGPPRVEVDGETIRIPRRKAMALLAYLALTGRAHQRDALATFLWPESDQSSARAELRRTLSLLNRTLGEGWLTADRETAELTPGANVWLDVDAFRGKLGACRAHDHREKEICPDYVPLLEEAVALYSDDFLAGCTLRDSAQFDEWQFFQTQSLRDELAGALERLAQAYGEREDYDYAIAHARRWLSLDPLHEPAHRTLMRLYAQAGQRTAVLRQYRECVRVLEKELSIAPSADTRALYDRIRAERALRTEKWAVVAPPPCPQGPSFLGGAREPPEVREVIFVARERELAKLDRHLDAAVAGRGGVVFVTGDAGQGKTALMVEFARRSMDAYPDLLVATGNCNAYSGIGDPYLPFREVMSTLTGEVEARWRAGDITREHARRLWDALPLAVGALLDHGPALIDILVPGPPLLSRAAASAPDGVDGLRRLRSVVQGEKPAPGDLAQSQLFEQVTEVLRALSARRPLLLLLDDLQWADGASTSLLFHLGTRLAGTRLAGTRILIACAYRPEEVSLGRDGERHPLEKVLAEFKRRFGDMWIDLAQADEAQRQRFVEAYLDAEPNRLEEGFRRALFAHARGHPLFTVELLRAMQERGDLVEDETGRWVEGPSLDWNRLPARVEGVIEERIGRLEAELRDILSVASVEGEAFTVRVVAAVEQLGERHLLRVLSRELEERHRLVREGEIVRIGTHRLARYWFTHALFQQYLYNDFCEGERALLHREVATALEALYEGRTDEIVVQLAHHYAKAGEADKAVEYLDRAGDRARLSYAHQGAIDHYERALAFLKTQGRPEQAARMLMKLGLTHHNAFQFAEAHQAYEEGFALWQRTGRTISTTALPPAPHALRVVGVDWGGALTLDPAFAVDSPSALAIRQLFSGLLAFSPEENVEPDVAERWEVLEGGHRYVFHLREDVRWSDGIPVTAGDFEYAWKRALDPATRTPRAEDLYPIRCARAYHQGEETDPRRVGVRAVDERILVVELEQPTSDFLHLVTETYLFPVPCHAVQAHGAAWTEPDRLLTNGPFRLAAWEPEGSLALDRNPAYHRRPAGNVNQVKAFAGLEHRASALQMYEQDRLDVLWLGAISLSEQDRARQRHAAEYVSQSVRSVYFVGLDVSKPPFDDRRVRRALAMATDRERLADMVYKGLHFPATGGLWPPCTAGHSPGIALPYAPQDARCLLAEAGYPGGRGFPTVQALGIDRPNDVPAVEYLRSLWFENLGIDISWEMVELREFIKRAPFSAQKPPLWYLTVDLGTERDDEVFPIEGWFAAGWRNEAYEQLAEEIRDVVDLGERLRICREADRMLMEEAPTIVLIYARLNLLVKPWVTRFPLAAVGGPWWQDVVIEPH